MEPMTLLPWMVEVKNSRAPVKVVAAGRMVWKTAFLLREAMVELLTALSGTKVLLVVPTFVWWERTMLPRVRELCGERWKRYVPHCGVELKDGKGIDVIAGQSKLEPQLAGRGRYLLAVVDEPAFMSVEIIMVLAHTNRMIMAGTPRPHRKGDFDTFKRWWQKGGRGKWAEKGWKSWRVSAEDVGTMPPEQLRRFKKSLGPQLYKAEIEGKFVTYTEKEAKKRG